MCVCATFGLCRMEERATSPTPPPFFPLPVSTLPLPGSPCVKLSSGGAELLAEHNGQKFKYNDLVDVIMGTGYGGYYIRLHAGEGGLRFGMKKLMK